MLSTLVKIILEQLRANRSHVLALDDISYPSSFLPQTHPPALTLTLISYNWSCIRWYKAISFFLSGQSGA